MTLLPVGTSSGYMPRRGIAGSSGSTMSNFLIAAYVSEGGQVSHHWKERHVGLANFICLRTGEHQGQEVGVCGEEGSGKKGMGDSWDAPTP